MISESPVRNPLPAAQPGLLDRDRHLLPAGFGITASENVRIGTPGAVHENAPSRSRSRRRYSRSSTSSLSPRLSPTPSSATTIAASRRSSGQRRSPLADRTRALSRRPDDRLAWLSRDPGRDGDRLDDAVGRSRKPSVRRSFLITRGISRSSRCPNIFLICALLFALATVCAR